jgi:hypothetical protein
VDVPLRQKLFDLTELDIHDLLQMFSGQGLEEDDLVNAVQKLGRKCRFSSSITRSWAA